MTCQYKKSCKNYRDNSYTCNSDSADLEYPENHTDSLPLQLSRVRGCGKYREFEDKEVLKKHE